MVYGLRVVALETIAGAREIKDIISGCQWGWNKINCAEKYTYLKSART